MHLNFKITKAIPWYRMQGIKWILSLAFDGYIDCYVHLTSLGEVPEQVTRLKRKYSPASHDIYLILKGMTGIQIENDDDWVMVILTYEYQNEY